MNDPTVPQESHFRLIDPFELARRMVTLTVNSSVTELVRLGEVVAEPTGQVAWGAKFHLQDQPAGGPRVWLDLKADAGLSLPCKLCGESVPESLSIEQRFLFVRHEDEAARLDELAENYDVIAATDDFDLLALIEDEVILAVPLQCQHEQCPAGSGESVQADEDEALTNGADGEPERQNPFADLAAKLALKSKQP